MKVLPHVMRNINEFNIPAGNSHGYEILYFGVNLILMLNYRLSFDVEVKNSNTEIQVLIFSRKDVPAWKENNNSRSSQITPFYSSQGIRINDVFRPTTSDAYAFVLSNQFSNNTHDNVIKTEVTLIHNWQQEVKGSQLTDYKVQ